MFNFDARFYIADMSALSFVPCLVLRRRSGILKAKRYHLGGSGRLWRCGHGRRAQIVNKRCGPSIRQEPDVLRNPMVRCFGLKVKFDHVADIDKTFRCRHRARARDIRQVAMIFAPNDRFLIRWIAPENDTNHVAYPDCSTLGWVDPKKLNYSPKIHSESSNVRLHFVSADILSGCIFASGLMPTRIKFVRNAWLSGAIRPVSPQDL